MQTSNYTLSPIYSFEEFLAESVLKKLAPDLERPEEVDGLLIPPDFFTKKGFETLELNGATLVEVKKKLSHAAVKEMESYFQTHSLNGYNVLVVFFDKSLVEIPKLEDIENKRIVFADFEELKKKAKISKMMTEEEFYLENAKKKDWKEIREEIIDEARKLVDDGNNMLFLGAGVSMSAKMPSWSKLLKGLMGEVKSLKSETLEAFTELDTHVYSECGDSNLIMARYLETAIKLKNEKAEFVKLIRKHLYSTPHQSNLLTDLALIIKYHKADGVITYNFDDILEQELVENGLQDSVHFTSIARDAEIKGHNNLPIYHVHGIIPEHSDAADKVVFSEDVYHERYRDVYHWSNVEQLHALSRKHCFFIGLSMVDPNLRRLLDIARNMNDTDKPAHYAFLPRTREDHYCIADNHDCKYVHVSKSLIDKRKQKEIYDLNYTVLEKIYRQLGVNVIWYENHDEIPGLVEQIFGVKPIKKETTEDLKLKAEKCITKLEQIESLAPKFNPANLVLEDYINQINYINTYSSEYRTTVLECKDVLDELSDRVNLKTTEEMRRLLNHTSKFDNIGGFADFYRKWFEMVKDLITAD